MNIDDSIRAKYYGGVSHDRSWIVLHYTANGGTKATAKGNANYFANCDRQASAHFVVDEGDTIYRCVPEDKIAWAVGGNKYPNNGGQYYGICGNTNSISIEMVSQSTEDGTYYIPDKTVDHALELVKYLQDKYGIDSEHVIRHYDVNGKPCPWCWTNENGYSDKPWQDFKARLGDKPKENFDTSFKIKVIVDELHIRTYAGTEYMIVGTFKGEDLKYTYTIVETAKAADGGTWGKLKSGLGWINISPKYVKKIQ